MYTNYLKFQFLFQFNKIVCLVLMAPCFFNQQVIAQNFAGLFYFANHGHTYYDTPSRLSPTGDVWIMNGQNPAYGPGGGVSHWWGKPLWAGTHGDGTIKNNYLMYFNSDPNQTNNALLDWHADLITTAGIDFIILDITNNLIDYVGGGPSYISGTYALLNRYKQRIALGLPVPKIVFFVRQQTTLQNVQDRYFNNYPAELFFEYLGKKLVLTAAQDGDSGIPAVPTNGLYANYTSRRCWGLDPSGNFWQFKVNANPPPPPFYYNGQPEEMSATVATQASYMTNDGINPYPGAQGRQNGAYFTKYMDAAISIQPKFIFINGWNEWAAGNWASAGQPPQFVDLWGQEYSHDIEPMAGGHGWQYYNLMNKKVSEFKKKTTATLPDGTYQISIASDGSVMSTVTSATTDGVLINSLPYNGQSYQQWNLQQVEPGYYKITNKNSGKVLDVDGYSFANGGFIHQWTWLNGENQKWSIQSVGNGYYRITNKLSGKVLDISGAKSGSGLEVHQWEYLNAANQKWKITPPLVTGISTTPKNVFEIYPNPVNEDQLTIETPVPNATISITDILGTEIYRTQSMEKSTILNTQKLGLKSGRYFVMVKGEQFFQVKQIVIR
jgi:hypothetical protein